MNIYSIKNEKMEFFNRPIYCESFNEAMVYLQNVLMSDADRALIGLKDDLALYFLGTIDFVSGKIDAPRNPKKLCDLSSVFESIPEDRIPQTAKKLQQQIFDLQELVTKILKEKESDIDARTECIEEESSEAV